MENLTPLSGVVGTLSYSSTQAAILQTGPKLESDRYLVVQGEKEGIHVNAGHGIRGLRLEAVNTI